jgi:Ca-activated chloride channel homolog
MKTIASSVESVVKCLPAMRATLAKPLAALRSAVTQTTSLVDHLTRDIIVVIDVSPSMLETDYDPNRLAAARNAAVHLIFEVLRTDARSRVGIVGFGGKAHPICPLIPVSSTEKLCDAINALTVIESTNIAAGLIAARKLFQQGKSVAGQMELLLLSDGGHNTDQSPVTIADDLQRNGCLIRTRGIGGDPGAVDEMLLSRIASVGPDGNPLYKFDVDTSSLVQDFRDIGGITR